MVAEVGQPVSSERLDELFEPCSQALPYTILLESVTPEALPRMCSALLRFSLYTTKYSQDCLAEQSLVCSWYCSRDHERAWDWSPRTCLRSILGSGLGMFFRKRVYILKILLQFHESQWDPWDWETIHLTKQLIFLAFGVPYSHTNYVFSCLVSPSLSGNTCLLLGYFGGFSCGTSLERPSLFGGRD